MERATSPKRGRPRSFDVDAALAVGERLFHGRGYEVGVAELTAALGISPPSFYAAFGSKAQFFARVLDHYVGATLAADDILRPGREPAEALADLLQRAARQYAEDPELGGCLVLEAARGDSRSDGAKLAAPLAERRRDEIRRFVEHSAPSVAELAADYVVAVMSGMSASARQGLDEARLLAIAGAGAAAVRDILGSDGTRAL